MPENARPRPEHRPVDRRKFFAAAATGAAISLTAPSYSAVPGATRRLGVAFLGCGGRAQAHINLVLKLGKEIPGLKPVAVCDVWDGLEDDYDHTFGTSVTRRHYAQGLYPAARKCGLNPADRQAVTKDYRRVLERKDVDVVCISTPDHWHARMALDAMAAGKDVWIETPMARTPTEALAVRDAAQRHNRVVAVGAQGLADPAWRTALEMIRHGHIGALAHLAAGAFRNDSRGMWRFYRIVPEMNPRTIDWALFLGQGFEVDGPIGSTVRECPFDSRLFAQWRCTSPFSAGPFSDLLVHPTTKLLAATGLRFPSKVTGAGGLYQERDGREVPDLAFIAAEFPEGCQMQLTASTLSNYPVEEVIRGRRGTLKFTRGAVQMFADNPERASGFPTRLDAPLEPSEVRESLPPRNETESLWRDFLDCVVRRDRQTLCPPELGAAAVTVTALGWESCRRGQAVAWNRERRVPV